MRILCSYRRTVKVLLIFASLITSVTLDSFAQAPSKSEDLLSTQQNAEVLWPMMASDLNTSRRSNVQFTFIDPIEGKRLTRVIQAKLLSGIEEIVGGSYQPADNTVVILAHIKNITDVQMLRVGFESRDKKQHMASFGIGPVPASVAAAIQNAYGHPGSVATRRATVRGPRFNWPRLREKRRKCPRPWRVTCIPTPPSSPSPPRPPPPPVAPSDPGGPQPPAGQRPCHACKKVTLLCGEASQTASTADQTFKLSTNRFVSQNDDSDLRPCLDVAFVQRIPRPDGCRLCVGNVAWAEQVEREGKCGQELSIEAFQSWSQQFIQQLLAPIQNGFQPLTGEALIAAIRDKLQRVNEACIMMDELSHLLRQKACEISKVCEEWQSTEDHGACYQRPDVMSILEELYAILQDSDRFPSDTDRILQEQKRQLFKDLVCEHVAVIDLAKEIERCMCCVSKGPQQLTRQDCIDCVNSTCGSKIEQWSSQPSQTTSLTFCSDANPSQTMTNYCNDMKSGGPSATHTCDHLAEKPSMHQSKSANRNLSAIADKETDREPNCSPPPQTACCEHDPIMDPGGFEECCRSRIPDWKEGEPCRCAFLISSSSSFTHRAGRIR
jgi:hypothetical protein